MTIKLALLKLRSRQMFRLECYLLSLVLALMASPALAHSEAGVAIDFMGGFMHPIFGPDHVIAMVAVGLWGAFLGAPAIWLLPVVFPLAMAVAGAFGVLGVPLPGVEIGIAISAMILGSIVALAAKPPLWIAAVLVGAFAIFHGHAHGAELRSGLMPWRFRWALLSRPECCTSAALHLAPSPIGPQAASPCERQAGSSP